MNLRLSSPLTDAKYLFSPESKPNDEYRKSILSLCREAQPRNVILKHIGVEESYLNYKKYIATLLEARFLTYTDARHPQSPKQKYQTSQKGLNYLKAIV